MKRNTSNILSANFLRDRKLRHTPAREAVLELLNIERRPLTHQKIVSLLKRKQFDGVTIYRTLETLQRAGLLHRIQDMSGTWHFCGHTAEENQCAGNHMHFMCSACNQMSCLAEQALPWITTPPGAKIFSKQLIVHGMCAPCTRKEKMKHYRIKRTILGVALFLALPFCTTAADSNQDVLISAAASLKDVLTSVTPAFQKANPGISLVLNLGASGQLRIQIESGAPADGFISAAAADMDALEHKGLIDKATRRNVAKNTLVLVRNKAKGSKFAKAEDLLNKTINRVAIGNPETVPAGRYAKEMLEKRALFDKLKSKFVYAENVRQVLDYVARGEVDGGFVYKTDALIEPKAKIVEMISGDQHKPIIYPAATLKAGKNSAGAKKFIEFLQTATVREVFKKFGFE